MSSLSNLSTTNKPRNSKLISEQSFIIFKKICDFVDQLNEEFGSTFHEVTLYNFVLTKTKFSNKDAINRNIKLFSEFCYRNQESITSKDRSKMSFHKISYSQKAFLDIYAILGQAEDPSIIWSHLLVIQATIDPNSEAVNILKSIRESTSTPPTSEGAFLNNFLGQMAGGQPIILWVSIASLFQGGGIGSLIQNMDSKIQSGELNQQKLVSTMQNMLGIVASQLGNMNNSSPSSSSSSSDTNPLNDIGGLLGPILSVMGGGDLSKIDNLNPEKMREKIEEEVAKEKAALTKNESESPD